MHTKKVIKNQFQLTKAKTGVSGKKKKWWTFENHGICFLLKIIIKVIEVYNNNIENEKN